MPFNFFGKNIENDEVIENFYEHGHGNVSIFSFLKNQNLIPLIYWNDVWDDHEVATLEKLKTKKVWKYTGVDNKKNYLQNLKKQSENWYYRDNEVNYTLNSYGYRTKEFDNIDWENSIIMFGCSNVFCSGVDDKHTISSYLEKITNRNVVNMGIPGSSIFSALCTSLSIKNNFPKPFAVIFSWTSLERYTLFNPSFIKSYASWNMDRKFFNTYGDIKVDIILKNLLYVSLAKSIWNDYCQYYEYTHFESTKNSFPLLNIDYFHYWNEMDFARDILHHGPKTNLKIALNISKKLQIK
jgi:hypothetical protein